MDEAIRSYKPREKKRVKPLVRPDVYDSESRTKEPFIGPFLGAPH
jgi:hypothetical protein